MLNKLLYIDRHKEVVFLTLFVILVLFSISPDSYLHDLFNRQDSAWFFTCGKAWMNGMTPYVDFTDSKGPLLMFIYGIAYLLSNTTYLGIFWISCLFYTITYYYTYKTAKLFLHDNYLAATSIILLSLSYFNSWIHYEFRAEDCCQPFIAIVLYRLCLTIYFEGPDKQSFHLTNFLLGFCFTAMLLIKYSLAAMLGPAYLYYLYYVIRNRKNIIFPLIASICGCFTIAIPFSIYFVFKGNLQDFINEYFLNTLLTVQGTNSFDAYVYEWLSILCELWAERLILLAICVTGCLWMAKQVNKDRFFPLIMFSGFFALSLHHAFANYYMCSCLVFPIWLCMAVSQKFHGVIHNQQKTFFLVAFGVFSLLFISNHTTKRGFIVRNSFFYDNQERTDYYHVAYLMSQIHKPKVIYLESQEYGYGTPADALPGCKYWSSQLGATSTMQAEQLANITNADFIITDDRTPNYDKNAEILSHAGFKKYYSYELTEIIFDVWSKHELSSPPADFHVSNTDVLFKRKVLQLK